MFSEAGFDYFCFRCDRFAERSLPISFPLHLPQPPPKTHTHTPSQPGLIWLVTHRSALNHQAFWRKLTLLSTSLFSIYIILQVIVLNFSMLTMFPRSISLEQTKKKKIWKFIIFFHQYIWHHLWRVNKKHTVKRIDQDKMLLFVPHKHRGIFKQRKTFHDSPGAAFSWIIPTCSRYCGWDCRNLKCRLLVANA